ncbi:MAG TPA: ABC transporter permease [Clostridiaceae bacterium]|nr:ABC transporter permease [Clostridiaceae bacterium]
MVSTNLRKGIFARIKGSNTRSYTRLIGTLIAVLLALLLGGIVISIAGANPIEAYGVLLRGAFGSTYALSETLLRATPVLLAAIGLSISFRSNLTSIGAEGQIIIGGITSCLAGLLLPTFIPAIVRIVLIMFFGFLGGALYGIIPGFLKAKWNISETIVTIMSNYVAINVLSYLLNGPMKEVDSFYPQSAQLDDALWLPVFIKNTRLHIGLFIALAFVVIYYFFMFRLPIGFKIRAVGYNASAAEYAGVKVSASIVLAMALSGGMAGLAGTMEVFGVHHRLYNDFAAGFGFDAIAVALLGRLHPVGIVVASIFFAALQVGSGAMQRAVQVPTTIVYIIQGLLIMFVCMDKLLSNTIQQLSLKYREKKRGA